MVIFAVADLAVLDAVIYDVAETAYYHATKPRYCVGSW